MLRLRLNPDRYRERLRLTEFEIKEQKYEYVFNVQVNSGVLLSHKLRE